MATKDTVVQELVVNTLTHKQFKAAQEAGTLSPYELYGTPDTSVRLPVLTPMWFDHIVNDVSWLRADNFSWHSGDVYVAAYEHLTEDLERANRLFLAWVSGTHTVYTLDENAGSDVYSQSTIGYMAKQSNHIATGSSVQDERTGDIYTRDSSKDIEAKALYTDTIDGNEIRYYLASDGHKICLPDQEANVSALYEATGVAWYYILDTENKQFKLPRSKHNKYASTLPVVGTGMTLGLTTGSVNTALVQCEYSAGTRNSAYGQNVGVAGNQNYNDYRPALGVTTDPENSGVIATQEQDTDQYKYLYFYVGNFTQDAVEQTAGLNAELFNGKLDIELGNANATTKSKIVGWGMPDYSASVSFTPAVGTTFTAPTDGIALVYLRVTGGNGNLVFNGITIGLFGGSNANHNNFSLPVNKGDTITVTMNTGAIDNSIGNFYPLKGVN